MRPSRHSQLVVVVAPGKLAVPDGWLEAAVAEAAVAEEAVAVVGVVAAEDGVVEGRWQSAITSTGQSAASDCKHNLTRLGFRCIGATSSNRTKLREVT